MSFRRVLSYALPVVVLVAVLAVASSAFATSATLPLNVSANGKTFAVPSSLVSFDTTGYASAVDTAGVTNWVRNTVAAGANVKVLNWHSTYDKKKKRLRFWSTTGYTLTQAAAASSITTALWGETTASVAATKTVTIALSGATTAPKKLGKQILVVQSLRRIFLYDNNKIIKTYRCAVGMKAYPTYNGDFHIGKKNPAPTWTNGYAAWSKNMPAYIGPGPNNPLGTRAMYIYYGLKPNSGSDTGMRFHGVPPDENSSIGHAASHGCLRMHRKDVEAFYPLVPLNTPVHIRA